MQDEKVMLGERIEGYFSHQLYNVGDRVFNHFYVLSDMTISNWLIDITEPNEEKVFEKAYLVLKKEEDNKDQWNFYVYVCSILNNEIVILNKV